MFEAGGRRRAALNFLFITVLLDMLALGIVVPVLPRLVVDFLRGDAARAAEVIGLFATVWALMQLLFSPLLGLLSDRFGRRPVILLSNLGSASTTWSWPRRRRCGGSSSGACSPGSPRRASPPPPPTSAT